MSPRSQKSKVAAGRGFTLAEALVSLTLLVIVMVTSMTMLFQMSAFAERQQVVTAPRQTARRALDYLTYFTSGAADTNLQDLRYPNPNALVMWYDSAGVTTQASYNNVTNQNLANLGTDIFSVAMPNNPRQIFVSSWPQILVSSQPVASSFWVNFSEGCPVTGRQVPSGCASLGDACNLILFQNLTGMHAVGAGQQSNLLQLYDSTGRWTYGVINGYNPNTNLNCAAAALTPDIAQQVIQVNFLPGGAAYSPGSYAHVALPHAEVPTLTPPIWLAGGVEYRSFRVIRADVNDANSPSNLEQKIGLFDAAHDNPYPPANSGAPAFTPIIENVEDLQVAYIIRNDTTGTIDIQNTVTQTFPAGDNQIPQQAGPVGGTPVDGRDVVFVQGIRLSIIGRSPGTSLFGTKLTSLKGTTLHTRPAVEDHAAAAQDTGVWDPTRRSYRLYDRYRQTATLFLKNRMLGN
jgi:type II secretory pathway pseudopilin PulG